MLDFVKKLSRKSQKPYGRRIVEKAKKLVGRKKADSDPRQEDLRPPATETTAQAAAGCPTGQEASLSPHTTETVAQEAAVPPTKEDALSPQTTETVASGAAVPPTTLGNGSSQHATETATQEKVILPTRRGDRLSQTTETAVEVTAVPLQEQDALRPHTTETTAQVPAVPPTRQDALNPRPTPAEALHPATAATPSLSSKNAKIWNQALQHFQQNHEKKYGWLVAGIGRDDKTCIQKWNGLFDPVVPQKLNNESHAVQGAQRWLPTLGLLRSVGLVVTRLDPHQVAPYVVAGVFFSIEIALNLMRPEDRDTTLDIVFETTIAINELIIFESLFAERENSTIKEVIDKFNEALLSVYVQAMRLLAKIQHSCDNGFTSRLEKLGGTIEKWKGAAKDLKRKRDHCSSLKKQIADELAAAKSRSIVLGWIKDPDDPELGFEYIVEKGRSERGDGEYGQWLLDTTDFKVWANWVRRDRSAKESIRAGHPSFLRVPGTDTYKPVLWIHGNYGTGKTTLACRVISILQEEAKNRSLDNALRIIPYFCTASKDGLKRPNYETIIRSLAQKLSWKPDYTVAQLALTMHNDFTTGTQPLVPRPRWEKLLEDLISEIPKESVVVFLVDALDECSSEDDYGKFLEFMSKMVQKFANIQILLSSRQHINVQRYYKESLLYDVEVLPERTEPDMERHIAGEIQRRRPKEYNDRESVFFNPQRQNLLKKLEKSLKDCAGGMFIWVNIWLDLLLPQEPITLTKPAEKILSELKESSNNRVDNEFKSDYQRLWDANDRSDLGEYQLPLFHFFLCSFVPVTINYVTSAMRMKKVDGSGYDEELRPWQIKRVYANFLFEDKDGHLQFAHSTAESFILKMDAVKGGISAGAGSKEFTPERNHRSVTDSCLAILKDREHPAWSLAGPNDLVRTRGPVHSMLDSIESYKHDLQTQEDIWLFNTRSLYRADDDVELSRRVLFTRHSEEYGCFALYVLFFWLDHFNKVNRNKTIFDPEWIDFLDIVLAPQFAFWGAIFTYCVFNLRHDWRDVFHKVQGRHSLLYPHMLATMFSIKDTDFSDAELKTFKTSIGNKNCRSLLLQHSECQNVMDLSALALACRKQNTAVVRLLLEGTRFLDGDRAAWSLLFIASEGKIPLQYALEAVPKGAANYIVEILLDFEEKVVKADTEQEKRQLAYIPDTGYLCLNVFQSGLHKANEDCILHMLKFAKPKEYNHKDAEQNTSLHISAMYGFVLVMTELVEQLGADINAKNESDETPLHNAVGSGNFEAVKYLLGRPGIKPAELTTNGETPLTLAKERLRYFAKDVLLFRSGYLDELQDIVNMLEKAESRTSEVDGSVEPRITS